MSLQDQIEQIRASATKEREALQQKVALAEAEASKAALKLEAEQEHVKLLTARLASAVEVTAEVLSTPQDAELAARDQQIAQLLAAAEERDAQVTKLEKEMQQLESGQDGLINHVLYETKEADAKMAKLTESFHAERSQLTEAFEVERRELLNELHEEAARANAVTMPSASASSSGAADLVPFQAAMEMKEQQLIQCELDCAAAMERKDQQIAQLQAVAQALAESVGQDDSSSAGMGALDAVIDVQARSGCYPQSLSDLTKTLQAGSSRKKIELVGSSLSTADSMSSAAACQQDVATMARHHEALESELSELAKAKAHQCDLEQQLGATEERVRVVEAKLREERAKAEDQGNKAACLEKERDVLKQKLAEKWMTGEAESLQQRMMRVQHEVLLSMRSNRQRSSSSSGISGPKQGSSLPSRAGTDQVGTQLEGLASHGMDVDALLADLRQAAAPPAHAQRKSDTSHRAASQEPRSSVPARLPSASAPASASGPLLARQSLSPAPGPSAAFLVPQNSVLPLSSTASASTGAPTAAGTITDVGEDQQAAPRARSQWLLPGSGKKGTSA